MKLSNPRLVRHAGFVGGAIIEPGDGELIFPGIIQQTVEIGDPLSRVYSSAQALPLGGNQTEQSFFKNAFISVTGVGGGSGITFAFPGKGIWRFDWTLCHAFFGTNNAGVKSTFQMSDPDGNASDIAAFPNVIGTSQITGSFTLSLDRVNFGFALNTSATIAADGLFINAHVYGKRIA